MSEEININELDDIYAESYPNNSVPDKEFTAHDLIDGYLYIPDILPGNVTIIDNNGKAILADQSQKIQGGICIGVLINLSNANIAGNWKIRYNRGMRGQNGNVTTIETINPQIEQQLIKYALIFG